jgi:hypothetical protein
MMIPAAYGGYFARSDSSMPVLDSRYSHPAPGSCSQPSAVVLTAGMSACAFMPLTFIQNAVTIVATVEADLVSSAWTGALHNS